MLSVSHFHIGALQIENSEESDQGKYECVATNSAGTRYSAPANLYVRGLNFGTSFLFIAYNLYKVGLQAAGLR
uniref:Uncharacterized protein n=1 Tax=Sphaerodactylus townsendi TaxID=933632 RepID=A0ACB8F4Q2_9SAUR